MDKIDERVRALRILMHMTNGESAVCDGQYCRIAGRFESVLGVIFDKHNTPVRVIVATASREVSLDALGVDWPPMQPLT